jgi:hypothetical protein
MVSCFHSNGVRKVHCRNYLCWRSSWKYSGYPIDSIWSTHPVRAEISNAAQLLQFFDDRVSASRQSKARRRRLGRCLHLNRALSLGCGQLRFLSSRWHRAGSPIEEEEHSFFAVRKDSLLHQLFNEAHRGSNRPVAYLKCDRLEQKQRRLKARGGDSGYCLKHTL